MRPVLKRPRVDQATSAAPSLPSEAPNAAFSHFRHIASTRLGEPGADAASVLACQPESAQKLTSILSGVAFRQENATILVVGGRGSRKSTLVRAVLEGIQQKWSSSPSASSAPCVIVELNGSVLDDDTMAARELCRQLSLGGQLPRTRKTSMEFYLRFLFDSLKEGRTGNVPVFILLTDFDRFTTRAKQTLLYNLFDITQSPKYQVGIIGTTTRMDATELLEKRLRSRFSQRQVILTPLTQERACGYLRALLSISASEAGSIAGLTAGRVEAAVTEWGKLTNRLLSHPDVLTRIERSFRLGRRVRWYQRWLWSALQCTTDGPLSVADLIASFPEVPRISEPSTEAAEALGGLSPSDLTLLIAMCKLETRTELTAYSFEMAYQEYLKAFKSSSTSSKLVPRSVLLRSVEKLLSASVLVFVGAEESVLSATKEAAPLRYRMVRLSLSPGLILDRIRLGGLPLSVDVQRWASD